MNRYFKLDNIKHAKHCMENGGKKPSCLNVLSSILEIVLVVSFAPIINLLVSDVNFKLIQILNYEVNFILYCGWIIFLSSSIAFLKIYTGFEIAQSRSEFERQTRNRLFNKVLYADWVHLDGIDQSEMFSSLTEEVNRASMAMNLLISFWGNLSVVILYAALTIYLSPIVSIIVLAVFLILMWGIKSFVSDSQLIGTQMNSANDMLYQKINDFISNLAYVKQNRLENLTNVSFNQNTKFVANLRKIGLYNSFKIKALYEPVIITVIILILLCVRYLDLSFSSVAILLISLYRMSPRISQLQREIYEFNLLSPSIDKIQKIMKKCGQIKELSQIVNKKTDSCFTIKKGIIKKGKFSLRIDNFFALSGQLTVLKGESGTGKSTLLETITGLRSLTIGNISYPKNSNIRFAYVPQNLVVFGQSIRENLILDNSTIEISQIIKLCEIFDIHNAISNLEDAYETKLTTSETKLSGGQLQRLMLIRAFLQKPEILILDESTSSLDHKNEEKVLNKIKSFAKSKNIVVIMAAHRDGAIRQADRTYTLSNGFIEQDLDAK